MEQLLANRLTLLKAKKGSVALMALYADTSATTRHGYKTHDTAFLLGATASSN